MDKLTRRRFFVTLAAAVTVLLRRCPYGFVPDVFGGVPVKARRAEDLLRIFEGHESPRRRWGVSICAAFRQRETTKF
jgi:hypothetical protein